MITTETIIINNVELPSAEINRLLAEGRKIEAIAYIVKETGFGLKETKHLVDNLMKPQMSAETIKINNVEIPAGNFHQLIAEGKKLEAIAYIKNHTGMGLKEAKDLVENFDQMRSMMAEGRSSSSQNARATKFNGKVTVRYTEDYGSERIVTPADADWEKVKRLMGDNEMMTEYEKSFKQHGNETMIDDALAQSGTTQQNSALKKYLVVGIVLILLVAYFFLK